MACVFAVFALNRCAWCGSVHIHTHTHTHTHTQYIYWVCNIIYIYMHWVYIYVYIYIYIYIYIYALSMCEALAWDGWDTWSVLYVSWGPILKMFSKMFSQCKSAWCPESSQPLSSCHAIERADYICTLWLRVIWRSSSESNHTYFTHYKYIRPNILKWCTRSIYISLCTRGFVRVSSHAHARVSMRLFLSFFSGYSLVVAWHR